MNGPGHLSARLRAKASSTSEVESAWPPWDVPLDHQGVRWDAPHAVPSQWAGALKLLDAHLHVRSPRHPDGGARKGDAWRPHPALALNKLLRQDVFPTLDLESH